jgi:hypothetical protein
MMHRIAGPPHRPSTRISTAHAGPGHLFVSVARPQVSDSAWDDDAEYLNASPLARMVVRFLMRFF